MLRTRVQDWSIVLRAKPVRASFRLLASPNSRVGYLPVTDHLEILGIAEISCTDEREGCRTAIGNNQRAFRIAGATVASNGRRGVLGENENSDDVSHNRSLRIRELRRELATIAARE